jgi:hypothetical protein
LWEKRKCIAFVLRFGFIDTCVERTDPCPLLVGGDLEGSEAFSCLSCQKYFQFLLLVQIGTHLLVWYDSFKAIASKVVATAIAPIMFPTKFFPHVVTKTLRWTFVQALVSLLAILQSSIIAAVFSSPRPAVL